MRKFNCLILLALLCRVLAHGDHEHSGPAKGESISEYAQRHVSAHLQSQSSPSHLTSQYVDVL